MKFKLNKKRLKTLSKDLNTLPANMTKQIGGGAEQNTGEELCPTQACSEAFCTEGNYCFSRMIC
ncbi:MAG: hypothetical protein HRU25_07165 [Psychrobium sp.]|nr:hypothetical protein [Psychrobium sp.]